MAIDYDTSALPQGDLAWQQFFDAVERSSPSDETEWLEHKAGVEDPTTKAGSVLLAKAIVGFANRDPHRASAWLYGHALILVGLEPGNVRGVQHIDPATLHSAIERYLAAPAPGWWGTEHDYKDKKVLVITVAPPKYGDPIAMIGRETAGFTDGQIFVRRPGKTEPAKSADLRRLEARLTAGAVSDLEVSVEVAEGEIPWLDYGPDWLDNWISAERARLMRPLAGEGEGVPEPEDRPDGERVHPVRVANPRIANLIEQMGKIEHPLFQRKEEDRTAEQYEAQVDDYLTEARRALAKVIPHLQSYYAGEITFVVRSNTAKNYRDLQVELHVEGSVVGFEEPDQELLLDGWAPDAPRVWGPREVGVLGVNTSALMAMSRYPTLVETVMPDLRLGPTIINGGSATITFHPFNLRPGTPRTLSGTYLLAANRSATEVHCSWKATATNVDAIAEGEFTIPIEAVGRDVSDHLASLS